MTPEEKNIVDKLSQLTSEEMDLLLNSLNIPDRRAVLRLVRGSTSRTKLEIPEPKKTKYEDYITWDDGRAEAKKTNELSENEKRRSLLFSLAKAGEISNEQFPELIDSEEASNRFLSQYVQNITIPEYVKKFGEGNAYLDPRLSTLLDEYWMRSRTPEQIEILSEYPEDYYQLNQVLGDIYKYPDILEEEEAPESIKDILLIDELEAQKGESEGRGGYHMSIMLFRDIVRDKILLHPEIDKVFDWLGATKEKHISDKDWNAPYREEDRRLESETVLWKKGRYTDLEHDERAKIQELLFPESQTFVFGADESFRPERVSAWQRGSEQFKKYLDTVDKTSTETYYHITPMSNLENILHEGLIRGRQSSLSTFLGYRSRTGIFVVDLDDDSLASVLREARRLKRNIHSWAVLEVEIPSDCYMTLDPKMSSNAWIAFCDVPPSGVKFIQEVKATDIQKKER